MAAKQTATKATADGLRDHMARVTVTDDVWAEFTQAVRLEGRSVSLTLGELVRADVGRRRRAAGATETASARRAVLALEDAKALAASLTALTARLESLATWERRPVVMTRNPAHVTNPTAAPYLDVHGHGVDEHGEPWTGPKEPPVPPKATGWDATPPTPEELAEWRRKEAERLAAGGEPWRGPDPSSIPDWEE